MDAAISAPNHFSPVPLSPPLSPSQSCCAPDESLSSALASFCLSLCSSSQSLSSSSSSLTSSSLSPRSFPPTPTAFQLRVSFKLTLKSLTAWVTDHLGNTAQTSKTSSSPAGLSEADLGFAYNPFPGIDLHPIPMPGSCLTCPSVSSVPQCFSISSQCTPLQPSEAQPVFLVSQPLLPATQPLSLSSQPLSVL